MTDDGTLDQYQSIKRYTNQLILRRAEMLVKFRKKSPMQPTKGAIFIVEFTSLLDYI